MGSRTALGLHACQCGLRATWRLYEPGQPSDDPVYTCDMHKAPELESWPTAYVSACRMVAR